MKLLITGAKGQLGQEVSALCAGQPIEVVASDRADLDIADFSATCRRVESEAPDFVVNCAAYNAVDLAEREWESAYTVNGLGSKHLAIATDRLGIPLVHFGTDYVFDGHSDVPYTVADTPRPLSRYGMSKLLGERWVAQHNRRHYILRLSWVFGPGNVNFASKVLSWAAASRTLRIVDDQRASPCYTADAAEVVLALLNAGGAYGLYHCTNTGSCSRLEWAQFIVKQQGVDVDVLPAKSSEFPSPAQRPAYSVLDSFPLKQVIGREMPTWQDATRRFLSRFG